jgi:hypothetical protein
MMFKTLLVHAMGKKNVMFKTLLVHEMGKKI